MDFSYELKIPKERIAVLIGKKGKTKENLEESTNTEIDIDSKEGDVTIYGDDALGMFDCREVIKAIGRGFNPDIALLLLKQDYVLEIINIGEEIKRKNQLERIRGRIIGKNGRSRELIEEHTGTFVSVYGKTISIIGQGEMVIISKKAIEMLIKGSAHSSVYKFLETKRRAMKLKPDF